MAEDRPIPASFVPEDELEEERTGRRTRNRLIILGVVVALAVAYMVYAAFPGNALYFVTVSEFMGGDEYQDGRLIRVSGKLAPDPSSGRTTAPWPGSSWWTRKGTAAATAWTPLTWA